ncbi:MAG: SUMF1/EgtB/PvdO family nonheme iron enzyme [Lentimicrobium sp.]|jgi:formylglycine-generating enzyme required for sulfatase activity|nr:SUMF1/EgtB/PvdO family nonheme iron enzyme [Lentimicrobium sp.]
MQRKLPFVSFISSLILSIFFSLTGFANNLEVSNVSLTGQNEAEDYAFIRFDISWENSWRTSTAPNNWDAAWIFAKYRIGTGPWNHVTLSSTGHIAPAGSTISAPTDNVGVFLYRDADGSGTFSKTGVKLRWDYGANGIADNDEVEVKVFGIEMVYVPEGAFYVGSTTGGNEAGRFYTYPNTDTPYQITSEAEITVGIAVGNLNYDITGGLVGDQLGPIPSSYPKGYSAFYVMKHEIPHHAYVDFLNCLTRNQQNARTQAQLQAGVAEVVNRFVMVNIEVTGSFGNPTPIQRSSIRCDASIPANDPINFYCDLNMNNIPNEADDGQYIACVYPSWSDVMAYLDWSGLRPMSELEFEKSCRGPLLPVARELAWGTASISNLSSLNNAGTAEETGNSGIATYRNDLQTPTRVGMFAKPGNTRIQSGATYYGILDMTGNLWERPVNLGTPEGRTFTGLQGNGSIDSEGLADVVNWPGPDSEGTGFRGGYWDTSQYEDPILVASRRYADEPVARRRNRFGGRGVRTAP